MTALKSICTFSLIMLAVSLQAQVQYGDISGNVLDRNGEAIPKSKVSLTDSMGAGTGKETIAELDGYFSLKPLLPGKYNVAISAKDCSTQTQRGVIVRADKSTMINVHLDCVPPQKKSHKRKRKI